MATIAEWPIDLLASYLPKALTDSVAVFDTVRTEVKRLAENAIDRVDQQIKRWPAIDLARIFALEAGNVPYQALRLVPWLLPQLAKNVPLYYLGLQPQGPVVVVRPGFGAGKAFMGLYCFHLRMRGAKPYRPGSGPNIRCASHTARAMGEKIYPKSRQIAQERGVKLVALGWSKGGLEVFVASELGEPVDQLILWAAPAQLVNGELPVLDAVQSMYRWASWLRYQLDHYLSFVGLAESDADCLPERCDAELIALADQLMSKRDSNQPRDIVAIVCEGDRIVNPEATCVPGATIVTIQRLGHAAMFVSRECWEASDNAVFGPARTDQSAERPNAA